MVAPRGCDLGGNVMLATKETPADMSYEALARVERPYEKLKPAASARQRLAEDASASAQADGLYSRARSDAPVSRERHVREASALALNDLRRAAVAAAARLQESSRAVQASDRELFDAVAPPIRARHRRVLDEKVLPAIAALEA